MALNNPESCIVELLYKQTRPGNRLDYSQEIFGFLDWWSSHEPYNDELYKAVIGVLCDRDYYAEEDKLEIERYVAQWVDKEKSES